MMFKKKSRSATKPTSIGAILRKEQKELCVYQPIWNNWAKAVGPDIARRARPQSITRSGLLMVTVNSSVWMQELQFVKKNMIQAINEQCGNPLIKDIQFRQSSKAKEIPVSEPHRRYEQKVFTPNLNESARTGLLKSVDDLHDSELKSVLARILNKASE